MAERSTCNAEVRGSIPRVGTILKPQCYALTMVSVGSLVVSAFEQCCKS